MVLRLERANNKNKKRLTEVERAVSLFTLGEERVVKNSLLKIEGENRIVVNGVVESVRRLLLTDYNVDLTKEETLKKVIKALKTNGVIISIYEMVLELEKEKGK